MAGSGRFDFISSSPEPGFVGNLPCGPKGSFIGQSLDRSASFREGGEIRAFGSGGGTPRVSGPMAGNSPPLSQCLILDPLMMGDQKYTRSGELRRILGFSVGSSSEENSFGVSYSRPLPLVATEELKRYRETILDVHNKARVRAKKIDEHLHRLNKYFEAPNPKKQQKSDLLVSERSGGSSLKVGTQNLRNPSDIVTQRGDDGPKNAVPNKRVRTSVAETRAEYRSNGLARQALPITKDRDILKDNSPSSDLVEVKIRRLPAGGEGWDKKMKRKRSVGTAFTRSIDSDVDLKRPMYHKFSNESGLQSPDARGCRSGSINGNVGGSKVDRSSPPANTFSRSSPKHEQEKATTNRDLTAVLNKDKFFTKGNNKLNIREDSLIPSPNSAPKAKISRAPRSGSVVAANPGPNTPRIAGAPESWEQSSSLNKSLPVGANNRKRVMPSGSSSPPITQWVGQRPHKISRTRRANLVSPVAIHDEGQLPSEGCSPDIGTRVNSGGTSNSQLFRGVTNGNCVTNGNQQIKVKLESIPSPARFSEGEESVADETRMQEKAAGSGESENKAVGAAQNVGLSLNLTKKNKLVTKEEIVDGTQRLGRSGRAPSFPVASVPPMKEKLENTTITKPLRSGKPGSDKNGSKTGRQLKKLLYRKGTSRRGQMQNSGSPDFIGESDDDHDELLEAVDAARDASYNACSNSFWKKLEPIFASIILEDLSYFPRQAKFVEELHDSLSQLLCSGSNVVGVDNESTPSDSVAHGDTDTRLESQIEKPARMVEISDQFRDFDSLCGKLNSKGRSNKASQLYQRVLSALIVDDEIDKLEENGVERSELLRCSTNDLHGDPESNMWGDLDSGCVSTLSSQSQRQCGGNIFFPCTGSTTYSRSPLIHNPIEKDELLQGGSRFVHARVGVLNGLPGHDLAEPQIVLRHSLSSSSLDNQYENLSLDDKLVLELQSIGIYLDEVPDLDDGEDEVSNTELIELKKELHQQMSKKKVDLEELYKAAQQGKEIEVRELEQAAMEKLVELAYKKLLATRGSIASKLGIARVSKQVALAFAKKTLARCQTFEDAGTSCFNEPALRDAMFSVRPQRIEIEAEPMARRGARTEGYCHDGAEQRDRRNGPLNDFENGHGSDQMFAKTGPISNRGKKKEVLLDDVSGSAALRPKSTLASSLLGGAKGKRSDREREKDISNRNAKAGRPPSSNFRGERKLKTKPKQKTGQLSVDKFTRSTHPTGNLVTKNNRNGEVDMLLPVSLINDASQDNEEALDFSNLPLPEFDAIDELGGPQDLSSWLNFDEDGLQDHDAEGLDIPMDDLSALPMF